MNCPGCNATVPMLFSTAVGHRCKKCAETEAPAPLPKLKRGRPLGATTNHRDTAGDPPVFVRRQHRPAERLPVLERIAQRVNEEMSWVLLRDPDSRHLETRIKVECYLDFLRIVRNP